MPNIDKESGALVIRIVYDGPPLSGKTTSLRSLAQGLGVEVQTPQEKEGRTLFFDWMEYSGGLFEGRRIKCQLLSVPGQVEYQHRRRALMQDADVIVMVANTREGEIEQAGRLLMEVLDWSAQRNPPVGLIIQANQRDRHDSVPSDRLRERLTGDLPIAIVETVAHEGQGVRETFVLGVRLALDRARELVARDALFDEKAITESSEELLAELTALEGRLAPAPAFQRSGSEDEPPPTEVSLREGSQAKSQLEQPSSDWLASPPDNRNGEEKGAEGSAKVLATEVDSSTPRSFIPDPMMPGGFIWPPVHGRAFLHEVAALRLSLSQSNRGDWSASGEGWRVHSAAACQYESTDAGRPTLIDWARVHAANHALLSPGRAIILGPWEGETQRLWQLVRLHPSLREALALAIDRLPAGPLAEQILAAAEHLGRARALMGAAELGIRCTLWNVSAELRSPPTYLGLMPEPHANTVPESEGVDLIEREFGPFLRSTLQAREDRSLILSELARRHCPSPRGEQEHLARLAASCCA